MQKVNFKVLGAKRIEVKGEEKVKVLVEFKDGSVNSFVRFLRKEEKPNTLYTLIDGCKISFDHDMNLKGIVRVYDTKGIKKTNSKKNLLEEIEKEIEKKEVKKPVVKKVEPKEESNIVKHEKYDVIKTCIESNIPVYLYGEAGTGKNFTLEQIAKELGLDFYFTNSVQQEYKLTGFIDANGTYHETEFYKAFKNGGLFFLDEMDGSIPEVLILLNASIANGYFEFPNGKITAHKDFRVVSAGNTIGSGADEMYTGRMVLDSATLDRFVSIEFNYDYNVEMSLAKGNKELVDFVEELRTKAKETGIRATFSYRCIINVVKLENKMDLKTILKIAVVKGLDADTINCLKDYNTKNKYYKELNMVA